MKLTYEWNKILKSMSIWNIWLTDFGIKLYAKNYCRKHGSNNSAKYYAPSCETYDKLLKHYKE